MRATISIEPVSNADSWVLAEGAGLAGERPVMSREALSRPPSAGRDPWRLLLRAILLVIATGAFLLLMSTMASALDVPDATETAGDTTDAAGDTTDEVTETATGVVGGTTDAAGDTAEAAGDTLDTGGTTAETVGDTATDVVGSTAETVGETADAATVVVDQAVDDAGEATRATTTVVGDLTDGVVGAAGDTAGAGTPLVHALADDTLGGVSSTLDTTSTTLTGLVTDVSGAAAGAVQIPALLPTSSDPVGDTARSSPPGPAPPASTGGRSVLPRETLALTAPSDVHLASTGGVRPDPGGAEPGSAPSDGLPFPLDAAAAALSSLTEAGGMSLVWAFLALLMLLPAMDDRWLRFVRGTPPLAPLVALDGRPG